jgi:hypothetical protein
MRREHAQSAIRLPILAIGMPYPIQRYRPTRACNRPLRARDHCHFESFSKRLRRLMRNPLGGPAWNVASGSDQVGHRGTCLFARHVWSSGTCLALRSHAASLGTFGHMAHASAGSHMPRRSARLVARQMPRVAAGCLVASTRSVARPLCGRRVAGQARSPPAAPNPAFQLTASRARSLVFEGSLWRARGS